MADTTNSLLAGIKSDTAAILTTLGAGSGGGGEARIPVAVVAQHWSAFSAPDGGVRAELMIARACHLYDVAIAVRHGMTRDEGVSHPQVRLYINSAETYIFQLGDVNEGDQFLQATIDAALAQGDVIYTTIGLYDVGTDTYETVTGTAAGAYTLTLDVGGAVV